MKMKALARADGSKATDMVSLAVERGRALEAVASVKGEYRIQIVRASGAVEEYVYHNLIVKEGRRYLLDAALANSAGGYTEKTVWYVMLISNNVAPSDTHIYDTFSGTAVTEFTSYSGGVRRTWNGVIDGTAASITNSAAKASFSITGGGTLYGAALVSNSTLNDHAATDYLMSYSQFASPITVANGDTVNVTITLSLT